MNFRLCSFRFRISAGILSVAVLTLGGLMVFSAGNAVSRLERMGTGFSEGGGPGSQETLDPAVQKLPQFLEVAEEAGLSKFKNTQDSPAKEFILGTVGGGCAFLDYDNDGWLDILLVGGTTIDQYRQGGSPVAALYRNKGDGTFSEVTQESGLLRSGWGMGCTVGDYDNDGWTDIYLTGYGSSHLFRNEGNGKFTDVTVGAGVGAGPNGWSTSAAFLDYDLDGYLDLFVCRYIEFDIDNPPLKDPTKASCLFKGQLVMCGPRGLQGQADLLYRNNGDGSFTEVTASAGIVDAVQRRYGLGVVATDYNNDGYPDLYVGNDTHQNDLYRNNGDGTFTEEALLSGVAVSEDATEQGSMGVDSGDYDNNGWLDLFVTNFSHDTNELYQNQDGTIFTDVTWVSGVGQPSWTLLGWGTRFFDFDSDGWLDLIVGNGHVYPEVDSFDMGTTYAQRLLLLHNNQRGQFRDVGEQTGFGPEKVFSARGVAVGDYDNDGDLDVLVNQMDDSPLLFRNQGGGAKNNWLQVKLAGRRSNRSAIGARVEVTTSEGRMIREVAGGGSYASASDLRLHFGLGTASEVRTLRVHWPRRPEQGDEYYQQRLDGVAANQFLVIEEPLKEPRPQEGVAKVLPLDFLGAKARRAD